MERPLTVHIEEELNNGICWSAVCSVMDRFGAWAWQQLRDTFSHSGVKGVKVSVEETESVQLQSSVRPFFPENSAYDLWDNERRGR